MWTESWTFTWQHGSEWLFSFQCFLFTYVIMLACFLRFPGFVLFPQCGLFLEFSVYVAQFWFYFQYFLLMGTLAGQFSSVQLLSLVRLFETSWTAARQASLSITNSWRLPKLMSIESVIPSNHLILCRPLLLLPSIFPSIRVFSDESAVRIKWPKYWCFSFNINPSSEHPGLISFRMDWLDRLAVQETLKSLLQHHSSKASMLWHSAFFTV